MIAAITRKLSDAGLSPSAAARKADLFQSVERVLDGSSEGRKADERLRWFVPGRIEVLGKHTDYAGGRSLLCCAERGFCVAARPRGDRTVRIADTARSLEASLLLEDDARGSDSGWTVYAATVLRRVSRNFSGPLRGAEIAFASDLPRASGMSSSSALVVSLFLAISAVNDLPARAEYARNVHGLDDLAGYLGAVENGYPFGTLSGDRGVGTFGGSEDHTAILCCRAGRLSRYSFRPVRAEEVVPVPSDWIFVLADSGVAADKTGNARERYNRASLSAAAVLDLWREATGRDDPTLAAAASSSPAAPDRIREILAEFRSPRFAPEVLRDRFDQFFEESEVIVPEASEAFRRGDAPALGPIVDRSQARAEALLGNQIPETIALARDARRFGAIAASAFGAGFGGSVWALVPRSDADSFCERWRAEYRAAFPEAAAASEFFTTDAGPGALAL